MSSSSKVHMLIAAVSALLLIGTVSAVDDATYLVLAPKTVRRGADFTVSVSILRASRDVVVRAELKDSNDARLVLNSTTVASGTTQSLILQMPHAVTGVSCTLLVSGSGGLTFFNNASIEIKTKTLSLFVQTDKAIYKPGQKVMFRVLAVYPNLRPYKGSMDIAIYDSADNKIAQMLDKSNSTGVISGDLSLSDQTVLGEWKIEATAAGNVIEKVFEVAEYVLPKFKVSVELPSYLLVNENRKSAQSDLTLTVTAKYTYGQPVNGQSNVYIQLQPHPWDTQLYPRKHYTTTLKQGRVSITVPFDELLNLVPSHWHSDDRWRSLTYASVLVIANVTELATGKTLSGNATVRCHSENYKLDFLDMTPKSYKSGLDFRGYMKLSQADGSVPRAADVNSLVTMTITTYVTHNEPILEKVDLSVPQSGIIPFTLTLSERNSSSVTLSATFNNPVTGTQVRAYKRLDKFQSRDNQSIQVSANLPEGKIMRGEDVQFTVRTTEPVQTYSYQVLSKGAVILADMRSSSEAKTRHQFSLTVDGPVAQLLSPNARIIVWCSTSSGEIITDSMEVNVDAAFANEVSLSFDNSRVGPGDKLSLTVDAYRDSYVGILAVDQSVLLLKGGNDITQDMVMDELHQYDSVDRPGCVSPFVPLMIDRRRRKRSVCGRWYWPSFSGGSSSQQVFDQAGVRVMTDGFIQEPEYGLMYRGRPDIVFDDGMVEMAAAGPGSGVSKSKNTASQQEPTRVRVEFPETWLWSESSTGADGRARMQVTAPDTITSWVASAFAISSDVGLGVASDTSRLIVFKQFFVSLNLPYAVVRGEEFGLQITVFNYLSSELQVTVVLSKSSDFKIRHPNAVVPESIEMQQTVKVGAKDAVSVYFWVVPENLGQVPIEVRALSNAAADAVRRQLLVKPEGTPLEYSTSVFIDMTEQSSYSTVLNVALPPSGVVPDSQIIELTALGDLLGPSVNGLDKLVKMPYGCGEQNMLNFAPNIYIMKYLQTAGQLTADLADKSRRYMMAGYQRELTYQRSNGSFSAFGNRDPAGSIWLSAFVAKCFHEAEGYITVDEEKVGKTLVWIVSHQNNNGAFQEPPEGRVIHTDMQGGSSHGVALTAYVLIALLENRDNTQVTDAAGFRRAIRKAISFLERQLDSVSSDPYALNIISYALTLAESSQASRAVTMLSSLAKTEGGTKYWEKDSSAEEIPADDVWRPPYRQSRSVNIEMTAYALLVYSLNRDVSGAVPIAKWIIAQRNPDGGFSSTQDTVVALQALAEFASLTVVPSGDSSGLQLTAAYGDKVHRFDTITRQNALLLQTVQLLPSTIDRVNLSASGRGVGLVQLNVKYNLLRVNDVTGVDLSMSTFEDNRVLRLRTCARWTKRDQPSGMVVMEVNQLTGYSALDLDQVKREVGTRLKRVEDNDDKMILYLDELTPDETCMTLSSEKTQLVTNVQRAPVKVYSYYDPTSSAIEFYGPPTVSAEADYCKECPACCGNTGIQSTTTPLIITFTLAALLSCLLLI